ncbi:MAG: hypothetical protein IT422_15715 [Pirellulaceae bacterium]|nr:hypothetical protein [Pirellulaceae bacterium]
MSGNIKWIVFGLCFLALMAAGAVWYVEAKISQVSNLIDDKIDTAKDMVDGAVTQVHETVQAPIRAVSGGLASAGEAAADVVNSVGGAVQRIGKEFTVENGQDIIDYFRYGPFSSRPRR